MQATLEDFFKALRGSDLDVSLNAQIDAARATALVGWHDRELLKSALGATLAKTVPDRAVFDQTFDRFFHFDAFETQRGGKGGSRPAPSRPDEQPPSAAEGSDQGSGGPGGCHGSAGQSLSQLLLSGDSAALSRRMQQAARDVGLTDIWFFTQKGYYTQKIQQAMGLELLDREITEARRQTMAPQRVAELEQARKHLFNEVRNFVECKLSMYGTAPTRELHDDFLQTQKLSHIDRRDFARMHEIVRKIARRLAERHARRKRRELRGQLDFRRTMRANAAYGGVMFETFWRSTRVERPRVVAICDVSGSVRQYARFLLLFLYSLDELVPDVQSFAFTNHLVDVTATFAALPVEQAVDRVLQAVGGAGTDYGQVLEDIDAQLMHRIDRRTTVLILGDARNNRGQARAEIMKTLYGRARRVIWLNPEPVSFWGLGDSEMKRYLPYCHIARECNSLRHLERTLDQLLRTNSASA
ncbi:vWA domain-containing protein [Hydrogenophaga intermedia]|uniref:vWA domain-containing protein n=1 Tax=Hydrogenophaga intermedia TaxID=65786 RepID=UPI002042F4FA|nr:VWA domain-containing protein [Hydrogenophaga intermedia]MCM3562853.1 VWA domain-containing protein [Hydrogenophaga intermedia]